MKFIIVVLALAAVACAQEQNLLITKILSQSQDISPEGSYSYSYDTENGISAAESGSPKVAGEEGLAVAAEGTFRYTAPDGTPIAVKYVADENGFHAVGDHLPVDHPIPEHIQRSIEYNIAHPEEN